MYTNFRANQWYSFRKLAALFCKLFSYANWYYSISLISIKKKTEGILYQNKVNISLAFNKRLASFFFLFCSNCSLLAQALFFLVLGPEEGKQTQETVNKHYKEHAFCAKHHGRARAAASSLSVSAHGRGLFSSFPPNSRKKRSLFAGNSNYLLKLKKGLSSIKQIKNRSTDKQVYFDSLKGVLRTHTTPNVRPLFIYNLFIIIYLSFYLFSFNSSFNKLWLKLFSFRERTQLYEIQQFTNWFAWNTLRLPQCNALLTERIL